ncbi:PVC-type heme-binding CxxCH protein [Stratiformator vulcanicus]|uniref:Cytochrome c domain-containing protein n=1 Tax=Stratiformator vulcanicus TaxID=2527980 RepID=A0A517R4X2_9PLAN|nr:PVC-type heme-binding CxxCH protein [Stratiformator vulcanicus]QDT38921.1 hypothetical protein Pan189_33200 [Stratiformator vulcanicus]
MQRHALLVGSSLFLTGLFLLGRVSTAGEVVPVSPEQNYAPEIAEASNGGELALESFQIPDGMTGKVTAAEPDLANPVAFWITPDGRFYVCETFRQQKGVEDNRYHLYWLSDDLKAQTVADRRAYMLKHLGDEAGLYELEHDRIRLLIDNDGDGKVEESRVFADGFNDLVDGTGAGVLEHNGNVYYTCIPKLYRLEDTNDDGVADQQETMFDGFGVRFAFRGHDMHGLTIGPDNRLYFSIGDRGFHVMTEEGELLHKPDTGAIFRCELDGSDLEIFASGLRNPQELAFDNYGNLFTGDNNSDSGDLARWVHVIEGMDAGWRMYYQYLDDRGPFNRERIWYPYRSDPETTAIQPAYILPPVANISDGPSGLAAYPGVGLPKRYDNHFFLCDFRGGPTNSGVRSFGVKPKGASFELVDSHEFLWRILVTDCDFGYDGGFFALDWVQGWEGPGKGRIYRFAHPEFEEAAAKSGEILRNGLGDMSSAELIGLFENRDKRVRQAAHLQLASRPMSDWPDDKIRGVASTDETIPRLHLLWALGIQARAGNSDAVPAITAQLSSSDPWVRTVALRVLRDVVCGSDSPSGEPCDAASPAIIRQAASLLADPDARVRAEAALLIGRAGGRFMGTQDEAGTATEAIEPLLNVLVQNSGNDAALRHAAVMGLTGIAKRNVAPLLEFADHKNPEARLGVLLALRRMKSPEIAGFLTDEDPGIQLEAARAVHDLAIDNAAERLAAVRFDHSDDAARVDALARRIIAANFRLGGREHAARVLSTASNEKLSKSLRLEALSAMAAWQEPGPLDRVINKYRPIESPRQTEFMAELLAPHLSDFFKSDVDFARPAIELSAQYGVEAVADEVAAIADASDADPATREAALQAAVSLRGDAASEVVRRAVRADSPLVRSTARRLLIKIDPDDAVKQLKLALRDGTVEEQQSAIAGLVKLETAEADAVLLEWFDKFLAGSAPAAIQLDLIEAAEQRNSVAFEDRIASYSSTLSDGDPIAKYRVSLEGGDPENGYAIFFGRSDASCRRCHAVVDNKILVGPNLAGIGAEKTKEYLLESLVLPGKAIAKGFETVIVVTAEGKIVAGIKRFEDDEKLILVKPTGENVTILQDDIDDVAPGKSGMPEDLIKYLSRSDVRDLVAYLASLKDKNATTESAAGHE